MLTDQQLKALPLEDIKVVKRLRKAFYRGVEEFNMLQDGDLVMVCLSGGKDSYTLLDLILHAKPVLGIDYKVIAVNLDQKQPDFPEHVLPEYLSNLGVEYKILEKDTYSIVVDKIAPGKTMCSLCSRLRRGTLYQAAEELGATKIALGHHREDIVETLFLNMFFGSKLETMPPKYLTDDERHIVLRPMAYCKEKDIERYSELRNFPIIPCNLCGSQENLQRQNIKKMISDWEKEYPDRTEIILNSIGKVSPTHLMDAKLNNFKDLEEQRLQKVSEPT